MRLSELSGFDLVESVISLFDTLNEATSRAWWPREWADQVINSRSFKNWLNLLGISGSIGEPMVGGVGMAYPVGRDHIVKFTTDRGEAQAAAVMKGHDSAHAADVYGVHRVASHDHNGRKVDLYAIVMQRLNTGVSGKMRAAGNAVYGYLDDHSGFIEDVDATVSVVMARYVAKNLRTDEGMQFAVEKVVKALFDVQQRTGVLSQDPHGGNIGLKGRDVAFFDFGRSSINYDHSKVSGARVTSLPGQ